MAARRASSAATATAPTPAKGSERTASYEFGVVGTKKPVPPPPAAAAAVSNGVKHDAPGKSGTEAPADPARLFAIKRTPNLPPVDPRDAIIQQQLAQRDDDVFHKRKLAPVVTEVANKEYAQMALEDLALRVALQGDQAYPMIVDLDTDKGDRETAKDAVARIEKNTGVVKIRATARALIKAALVHYLTTYYGLVSTPQRIEASLRNTAEEMFRARKELEHVAPYQYTPLEQKAIEELRRFEHVLARLGKPAGKVGAKASELTPISDAEREQNAKIKKALQQRQIDILHGYFCEQIERDEMPDYEDFCAFLEAKNGADGGGGGGVVDRDVLEHALLNKQTFYNIQQAVCAIARAQNAQATRDTARAAASGSEVSAKPKRRRETTDAAYDPKTAPVTHFAAKKEKETEKENENEKPKTDDAAAVAESDSASQPKTKKQKAEPKKRKETTIDPAVSELAKNAPPPPPPKDKKKSKDEPEVNEDEDEGEDPESESDFSAESKKEPPADKKTKKRAKK